MGDVSVWKGWMQCRWGLWVVAGRVILGDNLEVVCSENWDCQQHWMLDLGQILKDG